MVLVSPVDFGLLVLGKVQPSTSLTVIRCMVAYSTRDSCRYRLLKIAGFETRIVFLPRETGPLVGGYSSTSIGVVVLRLRTTDGIEGIGYASFTPRNITSALKEVVDEMQACRFELPEATDDTKKRDWLGEIIKIAKGEWEK